MGTATSDIGKDIRIGIGIERAVWTDCNGALTLTNFESDKVSDSDNITVHLYGHPHPNRKQNRISEQSV